MTDPETTETVQNPDAGPPASAAKPPGTGVGTTQVASTEPTGTPPTEDIEELRKRLSAVNAESASRRHKITELETAAETARTQLAELTAERDKLTKSRDGLKADYDTLTDAHKRTEEALNAMLDRIAGNLPEATQDLLSRLPVADRADWLAKQDLTRSLLGAANTNAVQRNGPGAGRTTTQEELRRVAEKYGRTI